MSRKRRKNYATNRAVYYLYQPRERTEEETQIDAAVRAEMEVYHRAHPEIDPDAPCAKTVHGVLLWIWQSAQLTRRALKTVDAADAARATPPRMSIEQRRLYASDRGLYYLYHQARERTEEETQIDAAVRAEVEVYVQAHPEIDRDAPNPKTLSQIPRHFWDVRKVVTKALKTVDAAEAARATPEESIPERSTPERSPERR